MRVCRLGSTLRTNDSHPLSASSARVIIFCRRKLSKLAAGAFQSTQRRQCASASVQGALFAVFAFCLCNHAHGDVRGYLRGVSAVLRWKARGLESFSAMTPGWDTAKGTRKTTVVRHASPQFLHGRTARRLVPLVDAHGQRQAHCRIGGCLPRSVKISAPWHQMGFRRRSSRGKTRQHRTRQPQLIDGVDHLACFLSDE